MFSELFRIEKILEFCERVCYFFAVNIMFVLSVLPVWLFFLFIGIRQVNIYLPLFFLCMTSVPPAFSAVLYAMRRMIDGRERGPFKDYCRGYRMDFFQKYKLGFGQMAVLFILWTNTQFFTKIMPIRPFALLFGILFAFTVILSPNLYLLASRYVLDNLKIVKSAVILTITKPVCTLGNIAALGVMLALFELAAGIAVLCMFSIYGFLVAFINLRMLRLLEESGQN